MSAVTFDFTSGTATYTATILTAPNGTTPGTVSIKAKTLPTKTSYTLPSSATNGSDSYTVTAIDASGFKGMTNLSGCEVPSSITTIGASAFMNCKSLASITLPSTLKTIADNTFWNCVALAGTVDLSNVSTSIGTAAFYNCTSLTGVTLSESLPTLSARAFSKCSALTAVTIPAGITGVLNDSLFANCSKLAVVTTAGKKFTAVNTSTFYGCTSLTTFGIPSTVTSIGIGAFTSCSALESFSLNTTSTTFSVSGGVLYDLAGTTLQIAPKKLTTFTFPTNVTAMFPYAFAGCSKLSTVATNTATGLTSLPEGAFAYCESLTAFGLSQFTSIDLLAELI